MTRRVVASKRAQDSRPLSEPPLSEPLPEAASTPASARSAGEANAPDPDTDFFDPVMQTFRQVTQRVTFDPVPVMHTFRQMTNRVTTAINEELHAFNDVLTSGVKLGPTTHNRHCINFFLGRLQSESSTSVNTVCFIEC